MNKYIVYFQNDGNVDFFFFPGIFQSNTFEHKDSKNEFLLFTIIARLNMCMVVKKITILEQRRKT